MTVVRKVDVLMIFSPLTPPSLFEATSSKPMHANMSASVTQCARDPSATYDERRTGRERSDAPFVRIASARGAKLDVSNGADLHSARNAAWTEAVISTSRRGEGNLHSEVTWANQNWSHPGSR